MLDDRHLLADKSSLQTTVTRRRPEPAPGTRMVYFKHVFDMIERVNMIVLTLSQLVGSQQVGRLSYSREGVVSSGPYLMAAAPCVCV